MADGRQRIDKWLFFARVVKSRSLAAKLAQAGRVRINRDKATQAADLVKPGDMLTITLDRRILVYRVLDAGHAARPGGGGAKALRGPVAARRRRRTAPAGCRSRRCATSAAAVRPRGSGARPTGCAAG